MVNIQVREEIIEIMGIEKLHGTGGEVGHRRKRTVNEKRQV